MLMCVMLVMLMIEATDKDLISLHLSEDAIDGLLWEY